MVLNPTVESRQERKKKKNTPIQNFILNHLNL